MEKANIQLNSIVQACRKNPVLQMPVAGFAIAWMQAVVELA